MPTDIALATDLTSTIDAVGDLTTVTDDDYLVQRAVLRILSVNVAWVGDPVTPDRAEGFRSAVEEALQDDPEVDVPVSARINDVDGTEITLAVQVGERRLTFSGP